MNRITVQAVRFDSMFGFDAISNGMGPLQASRKLETVKLHITLAKIASSSVQNPEETTGHDALTREALPLELRKMSTDSEVVDVEIPPRRSFKILSKKIDSPSMRAPSGKTCSFNTYRTTTTFLSTSTTRNTTGRRRTSPCGRIITTPKCGCGHRRHFSTSRIAIGRLRRCSPSKDGRSQFWRCRPWLSIVILATSTKKYSTRIQRRDSHSLDICPSSPTSTGCLVNFKFTILSMGLGCRLNSTATSKRKGGS